MDQPLTTSLVTLTISRRALCLATGAFVSFCADTSFPPLALGQDEQFLAFYTYRTRTQFKLSRILKRTISTYLRPQSFYSFAVRRTTLLKDLNLQQLPVMIISCLSVFPCIMSLPKCCDSYLPRRKFSFPHSTHFYFFADTYI